MTWLVLTEILGGVVLFLVGMQWMSVALRAAAGDRLRGWLNAATASRWRGLALGTSVGFLAHSSAATVMTVGFVHAGLLSLGAALPVLFGANVGTTLSMQLVSLRLTDYALLAVALGGIVQLAMDEGVPRQVGRAVLGFGLIFLGMKISGDAITPYRETLAPLLARFSADSWTGLALGVGMAAGITLLVQSSGAVIGMSFVLAASGVVHSLAQTFPIVLGAHIGTTVTALVASIGTSAEARRAALANLIFNLTNAALGVVGARWLIGLLERTSPDLVHQTANAHTLVMLLGVIVVMPATGLVIRVLRRVVPGRGPDRPGSFLDVRKLDDPHAALALTMRELGRCAQICVDCFRVVNGAFHRVDRRALRRASMDEASVDEIRSSVRAYLAELTRRGLQRREVLIAQALNRCAIELERISDHIEKLVKLVRRGGGGELARLDEKARGNVLHLAEVAESVVAAVAETFGAEHRDRDAATWPVLEARNRYTRECTPVKQEVREQLSGARIPADLALLFSEYVSVLDRIVRHCTVIAQEQRQPSFSTEEDPVDPGSAR